MSAILVSFSHHRNEFYYSYNLKQDRKTLIVCQVLTGREYAGSRLNWPHHNLKVVLPDSNKCSHMVIIGEKDQILHCAVLHLSTALPTIPTSVPYVASFPIQHKALTITPVFVSCGGGGGVVIGSMNCCNGLVGIMLETKNRRNG